MKAFLNKMIGFIKHFKKEKVRYKLKDKVNYVVIIEDETFLIEGVIWKINKDGYLIDDTENRLENSIYKLWSVNFDDVIELA